MTGKFRAAAVAAPLLLILLVGATIFHSEGWRGFMPFANLEALLIVVGGTFLLTWSAYPLRQMTALSPGSMLAYAAECAVGMGLLGTILGLILMLSNISDISAVPRRMALSLGTLFWGFVLSEVILRPLACRAGGSPTDQQSRDAAAPGGKRGWLAFLGLGIVMLGFFVSMYALSAALAQPIMRNGREPAAGENRVR